MRLTNFKLMSYIEGKIILIFILISLGTAIVITRPRHTGPYECRR